MANANTIKEFLVRLGYQVDANSERKFNEALATATVRAGQLGVAVTAAAAAVVAGVAKMAEGLESLYYASQRTKASVTNISALGFAVGQMGGTADAARASLENLGRMLRSMPGTAGLLQTLRIDPKQDTALIMAQLGERFRAMPYFRARAYADVLGIDERTLDALIANTGEFTRQYRDMVQAAGLDQDRAAKSSANFMNSLRGLGAAFDILRQKVAAALTDRLAKALDRLRKLVVDNFDVITRVLETFAAAILTAADVLGRIVIRVAQIIRDAVDWFDRLDPKIKETAKTLGLLLVAWKALNVGFLATPLGMILAVVGAIGLLYDDWKTWKEGGEHFVDWDKWGPEIDKAWKGITEIADAIDRVVKAIGGDNGWQAVFAGLATYIAGSWLLKISRPILGVLRMLALIPGSGVSMTAVGAAAAAAGVTVAAGASMTGEMAQVARSPQGVSEEQKAFETIPGVGRLFRWLRGASTNVPAPAGNDDRATAAMNYFTGQGWTREQAAGIVANLHGESGFRRDAVGDGGKAFGLAQWHPDRQANFRTVFGKPIQDSSFEEQLAFVDWELRNSESRAGNALRAAKSAYEAGSLVSRLYERPADAEGNAHRRGMGAARFARLPSGDMAMPSPGTEMTDRFARSLGENGRSPGAGATNNVNQTNNINVSGSMDNMTAQHVLSELDRSNQDIVRNMSGSVQ